MQVGRLEEGAWITREVGSFDAIAVAMSSSAAVRRKTIISVSAAGVPWLCPSAPTVRLLRIAGVGT